MNALLTRFDLETLVVSVSNKWKQFILIVCSLYETCSAVSENILYIECVQESTLVASPFMNICVGTKG